jgi:hypothetical protein
MMRDLPANFPYRDQGICYVYVGNDKSVTCPHYLDDKREAVVNVCAGKGRLFGAWPGAYRTDLFALTDKKALRAAFNM